VCKREREGERRPRTDEERLCVCVLWSTEVEINFSNDSSLFNILCKITIFLFFENVYF